MESVINDIRTFFDFYSKIFNYYIREINNRNPVLQIINSNFIRNGLFIYFLNKITNLKVIPDTDDFFYSIFKIGETKISDPQSNVLYKLTGLPYINTNNVMKGGDKTIMDQFTLFLKKFTIQHEDMERIHLQPICDDLHNKIKIEDTQEFLNTIYTKVSDINDSKTDWYFGNSQVLLPSEIQAFKHNSLDFNRPDKWILYSSIITSNDDNEKSYNLYTSELVYAICAMINLVEAVPAREINTIIINDIPYKNYLLSCENLIRQIFGAILVLFISIVNDNIKTKLTDDELIIWNNISETFSEYGAKVIVDTIISARRTFGSREIGNTNKSSYKCNLIEKINCGIFQNLINKITTLNKDKKLKKKFKTKIDINDKDLNPKTRQFTNNLLISLAKNINKGFNKDNPSNLVYRYEKKLLRDIETKKSITTVADEELMKNFISEYTKSKENHVFINENVSYDQYIEKLTSGDDTKNFIINNALTCKIKKNKEEREQIMKFITDYESDKLEVACLISSIIDAQASFGSCNNMLPEEFNNSNIIIKSDNGINFEFGLNIYSTTKNLYIVKYYLTAITDPNDIDDTSSKPFGIYGEITEKLTKNRKLLLSAVNSFDRVLDLLEENYSYALTEFTEEMAENIIFDNILSFDDNNKIMGSLSNKAIGDISQELATIIENTGYVGDLTTKFKTRLLANGDRPSFVRASILLKELGFKNTVNKIDKNSGIFYSSEKGKKAGNIKTSLYIVKKDINKSEGGAIKNRKRGHKNRKNKTKKHKKHKKHKPKITIKKNKKFNKKKSIKKNKKKIKKVRKSIKK